MTTQHAFRRTFHGFLSLLFLFTSLLCTAPAAQAAPTTGWVDLQAHVPDGFKGSVSVALEHKQTGETQIVTCYSLNDYANSVQIPLGEYTVVSSFTSEDSFIYEASTKTEQFVLKNGVDIEVTVTHNPEGEGILAGITQGEGEAPEHSEGPGTVPSDASSTETALQTAAPDTDSNPQEEAASSASGEEDPEKESSSDTIARIVRNVLLTIAATLAFLGGIILLVVYVRCKFGSD